MCLLAAEMTARAGVDPGQLYDQLTERYGAPVYRRVDTPATVAQKAALARLAPDDVSARDLAGERIEQVVTAAPSGAPLGGVKVSTASGWFAARPSGTENICKLYAESFRDKEHLERILDQAQALLDRTLTS